MTAWEIIVSCRESSSIQGTTKARPPQSPDHMLSDQVENVAEARVLGGAEPLEEDHLGRHDLGAVPLQAADRGLLAFGAARAHRVAHEIDAPAGIEEAERGLQHADMRLTAGDHDGPPRLEPVNESGGAAGVE